MTNDTSVKIIELIEKSGLLSAEVLQKALDEFEFASGCDADAESGSLFLRHLVRLNLLTPWQAGKLGKGRHKGFVLGSYKLLGHIGSGGMSTVYLAEHVHLRQRRALKILPKHRVGDSSYLARFYREARAAAALDHPNVVHAYDVGNDGDVHYLVMEYVEGSDLQKIVTRRGVLSYESAADAVRQTAEGLVHAHKAGVVHRDIKPANLLIDNEGTVKILDMGLARFTPEELEQQASLTQMHDENVIGTTNYLAPEQALNSHKADARSDIYSLGCTLYFMLTGLPPFSTGSVAERLMMHLHKDPEPITKHRPGAPASLTAICMKMLAKKPQERYQSAEELATVLKVWRKEWLTKGAGDVASGVVISTLGSNAADDDRQEDVRQGSRETDALRGQATSLGRRSSDDDELLLADLDEVPNSSGKMRATSRAAKSPSSLSGRRATSDEGVSAKAAVSIEPSVQLSATTATPPQNDFLAELLASAAAPPVSPPPSAAKMPRSPQNRPSSGRSTRRSTGPNPAGREEVDREGVKGDVEKLFRKHPGFAAAVFLFFSGLLVFSLYYMLRPSEDASTNLQTIVGTSRDE